METIHGFDRAITIPTTDTSFQCHLIDFPSSSPSTASKMTTLILCLHGAGCSASSWSCLASEMQTIHTNNNQLSESQTFTLAAYDMRGHGKTTSSNKTDLDLSISTLVSDAVEVLLGLISVLDRPQLNIVLVGHSLGGAVVVRAAAAAAAILNNIMGVVVIDLVEGSALASLPHLPSLLQARPNYFSTVEDAIKWSLENRMVNNPSSAIHSIPPMLQKTNGLEDDKNYTWRVDLNATSEYWLPWYTGLSNDFLALSTSIRKLLILASTDRLDKTLLIGQMSGKFQLEVVQSAGHSVHEDNPTRTATLLWQYLLRNCTSGGAIGINGDVKPTLPTFDKNSLFAKRN